MISRDLLHFYLDLRKLNSLHDIEARAVIDYGMAARLAVSYYIKFSSLCVCLCVCVFVCVTGINFRTREATDLKFSQVNHCHWSSIMG